MSSMGSLTLCVQHLRSPDCHERDEAARIIWERFAARLQVLVRRHLDNRIRRREDEQDVLQSVYASFCLGQLEGKATPSSREELWKLLVRITMCKVVNTAHRHRAARRDVRRERSDTHNPHPSGSVFPRWMLEHVDRAQPSPKRRSLFSKRSSGSFMVSPMTSAASSSGSSRDSRTPRLPPRSAARSVPLSSRCSSFVRRSNFGSANSAQPRRSHNRIEHKNPDIVAPNAPIRVGWVLVRAA